MITFNPETHTYIKDNKKLISVTQLLRLAEISPDYSAVNETILRTAEERGIGIHKELENFCKNQVVGKSVECQEFAKYCLNNGITPLSSEYLVSDDNVAGTIDVTLKSGKKHIVADFKTTSAIHTESVSWQLSIYAYLLEKQEGLPVDELQVFHFKKDGTMTVKEVKRKPTQKVEELIEWYLSQQDKPFEIAIEETYIQELCEAEKILANLKAQQKRIEEKSQAIKDAVISAMKENGLTKFENENILINIIAPVSRQVVDSKKLKEEYPDIYDKCSKTSLTAESVRIKIKESTEPLLENGVEQL